jgi:multiple sugar transport system permease protein
MNKRLSKSALYTMLTVFAIIFVLPLLYSIYTSFKQLKDVEKIFVGLGQLSLDSYIRLITHYQDVGGGIGKWYLNTIIMTAIIVAGCCLISSMAGYALSKLKFPGKNLVFIIVLATMMIPYHMILIPVYIMMAKLGWLNSFASLTIPYLYQCMYIFLFRQFFGSIPNELLEAAKIDGLTKAGAFFRIMVPLSKPVFATTIIVAFTGTWNSYLIPVTFTNKESMFTLVQGLNAAKDQFFDRVNVTMAGVVLTTIPVIIIFLIFQKYYVEGIASTGIKG